MRSLAVFVALVTMLPLSVAKDESQAGDLVKQHLNSIGTEEARAAVKNRAVEGTVSFQTVTGGSTRQDGKQFLVSEGDKLVSLMQLPNQSYPGERFVSDGKKALVAEIRASVHSALGEFVWAHSEILTEGLWGGALSTGWALAHLDERHAKLQDRGLKKKVDGRELHRVDYAPKKHSDLQIELYFEPDSSARHDRLLVHSHSRDGSLLGGRHAAAGVITGSKSALAISRAWTVLTCRGSGPFSSPRTCLHLGPGQRLANGWQKRQAAESQPPAPQHGLARCMSSRNRGQHSSECATRPQELLDGVPPELIPNGACSSCAYRAKICRPELLSPLFDVSGGFEIPVSDLL